MSRALRVLVTGASGFVGRALVEQLCLESELQIRVALRSLSEMPITESVQVGDISSATDWRLALAEIDVVVHLAARAHIMDDSAVDSLAEFRKINTAGTLNLARQAATAGVKRFVFISSIGVNGAQTYGQAFTELSPVAPHSPYAQSKYEAECGLLELIGPGSMEVVIIRPPMIFAAHAPGNFARLMKLISYPVPLPLGGARNRRSLISLHNLISFIEVCLKSPRAANQVFLVSDGDDISTEEMVRHLALGMGFRRWLFAFPQFVIAWLAAVMGRRNMYIQLFGSLQVDSSKARDLLRWTPSMSTRQSLEEAGKKFRAGSKHPSAF
ncbi:NAD-dependent epimerase/dehydratase family protein [Pseudomonas vlassakiae]|uniref:NAD-dependent epimerase/dehydratase family protein n=1 Tax=Pseudomonas vlassakiae TaxID=485888 RepID=UPI00346384C5